MPYGLSKKTGGDTPARDAKMERCIQDVMSQNGNDKLKAILICKASIQGTTQRGSS
jgi:hypothetical protein